MRRGSIQGGRAGRPVKPPRVGAPGRGGAIGASGTAFRQVGQHTSSQHFARAEQKEAPDNMDGQFLDIIQEHLGQQMRFRPYCKLKLVDFRSGSSKDPFLDMLDPYKR